MRSSESPYNLSTLGFTLIEMLIVLAIIGLLAAIAYPAYLDQVRSSRRAEGKSLLLQAANRQERLYGTTSPNSYGNSMTDLGWANATVSSENEWYDVTVSAVDDPNADGNPPFTGYTLRATAQNDQTKDDCRRLEIDELGQTSAQDADGNDTTDTCW